MNSKDLKEKNLFLRKAYEVVHKYAPTSPLLVGLDPEEFGKSLGFDKIQTTKIMKELEIDGYIQSPFGISMFLVTQLGLNYLIEIEEEK